MDAILAAPATNDRSPRYMEKAMAAIHQALRHGQHLTLFYTVHEERLALACRFPPSLRESVLGPLSANYPKAHVEICDELLSDAAGSCVWYADVRLAPDLLPILRHSQFEDQLLRAYADPIDSLLRALRPDAQVQCRLVLSVTPASHAACHRTKHAVELLGREFFERHKRVAQWFTRNVTIRRWRPLVWLLGHMAKRTPEADRASLDTSTGYRHEREADLQAAADKCGGHLFVARMRIEAVARPAQAGLARERLHAIASALGAFTRSSLATFTISPVRRMVALPQMGPGFLLSHEELATLWHPPTAGVTAEKMQVANFTELEAPAFLPSGDGAGEIVVGRVQHRSDRRIFGLARDDRRRHVHIVGRTGVGKTTLLLNQIYADIASGQGVGLIDPHGDLADTVLRLIPRHRTNDVILFDAADREFAIAFNPLACPDPGRIDQVTSGAVAAFKKLYDSWGPRLENTLRNAVFATIEQGGTLLTLLRLLTDEAYREQVTPLIRDEVVRAFWQQEFARWSRPYRTEAVAAITNKIQPFLTNTSVRAIVSQPGRSLDLRRVMDEGQILIVNLSKGKVGEDNAALLGAFLVTTIQQAAMTRADVSEEERRDFYLYIDEFQNFVTTSFETILSEARKYRLNLTVSHQYLSQLNEATASAIAGNIGSIIAFAVGSDDAEWLSRAMATAPGQLLSQDLTSLPKYTAYARLLIDGLPRPPFSMTTPPPPVSHEDRTLTVLQSSRRQFSRPLAEVRRQISRDLVRA